MNIIKKIQLALFFLKMRLSYYAENIPSQIHVFLHNYVYGRPLTYLRHLVILYKLRWFSRFPLVKILIIQRLYRMQMYKYKKRKKEIYKNNMEVIAQASEEMNIPQHVLIEEWRPERFAIITHDSKSCAEVIKRLRQIHGDN